MMKPNDPEHRGRFPRAPRNREREILEACLAQLQKDLPLEVEVLKELPYGPTVDADLQLEIRIDGVRAPFAVDVKGHLRRPLVPPLLHQAHRLADQGHHLLVCAERVPADIGRELRDQGIAYLDRGGNAYLRAPGLITFIEGRQVAPRKGTPQKHTETQIRLLGEFLKNPEAGQMLQTELAARAGVALGAVGKRREELTQLGILDRVDKRTWVVRDRAQGLHRFAEGWAARLRPGLRPQTFRHITTDARPRQLEEEAAQRGCLVGGERAAGILTEYLRTEYTTLHAPPQERSMLAKDLGLVPDPGGKVTLLDRFGIGDEHHGTAQERVALAHPLLIWAECQMVPNHRVTEVAHQIHERLLMETHG